jgi:hypothetical protein
MNHTRESAEYVLALLKERDFRRIILVTSPFHQLRTYLTFAKVCQPHGIEILNYHADTAEWHPATWFLSAEHRKLAQSEWERMKLYRAKGDGYLVGEGCMTWPAPTLCQLSIVYFPTSGRVNWTSVPSKKWEWKNQQRG